METVVAAAVTLCGVLPFFGVDAKKIKDAIGRVISWAAKTNNHQVNEIIESDIAKSYYHVEMVKSIGLTVLCVLAFLIAVLFAILLEENVVRMNGYPKAFMAVSSWAMFQGVMGMYYFWRSLYIGDLFEKARKRSRS